MRAPAGRLQLLRPYALLACLCLLLYLPGLAAIPPLDRDEARFAQATRQMLESGDFLHIRFQDEERNKKPAGIYWLQAAAVALCSAPQSAAIWPYRLPSLLGALAAVLLLAAYGKALFPDEPGAPHLATLAALLLGSALGVVAEAHIAKTDAALLMAVVAGQSGLGIAYVRGRGGLRVGIAPAVLFWAGEIAAIFLKGPVGPALALLTIATLLIVDRSLRWLRPLHPVVGLAATALCVVPWLVAIERATGGRFIGEAAGGDLFSKLLGAQESHGAPPLSYLLLSVVSFWPGSLLLVPALRRGWQRRDRPAERFLLAWLMPAWVVLELVPTKLPHYVLPLYPALALLTAGALLDGVRLAAGSWPWRIDLAVKGLWLLATLALAALPVVLSLRFAGHLVPAALVPAVVLPALTAALFFFRSERAGASSTDAVLHPLPHTRRKPGSTHPASDPLQNGSRLSPGMRFSGCNLRSEVTAIAALALAFAVPMAMVLPALDRLWLSRAAAAMVAQHKPAEGMPLAAVGYGEPSLVFLLGTGLDLATPAGAAALLADGGEAIVSSRVDAAFRQAVAARGLATTPLASAAGLDYSNGQRMVLTLYDVAGTGH